jgi:hypothetical protein
MAGTLRFARSTLVSYEKARSIRLEEPAPDLIQARVRVLSPRDSQSRLLVLATFQTARSARHRAEALSGHQTRALK